MRKFLLAFIAILFISFTHASADTVAFWRVYLDDKMIYNGNATTDGSKIILDIAKIKPDQHIRVEYFDDTPCTDCMSTWVLKSDEDKSVYKEMFNSFPKKFLIATTKLHAMAVKNNSSLLKFYFKESPDDARMYLFTLQFK